MVPAQPISSAESVILELSLLIQIVVFSMYRLRQLLIGDYNSNLMNDIYVTWILYEGFEHAESEIHTHFTILWTIWERNGQ